MLSTVIMWSKFVNYVFRNLYPSYLNNVNFYLFLIYFINLPNYLNKVDRTDAIIDARARACVCVWGGGVAVRLYSTCFSACFCLRKYLTGWCWGVYCNI
jgi:hypothetical protein